VSQIGYMLMGLGIAMGVVATGDPAALPVAALALAGSVFYIFHHIIVKTNLFLVSGIVHRLRGTYQLKSLGGFYRSHPWLAVLFLIPALSLAGMPPLSGFFAKFIVIRAGIEAEAYGVTFIALLVGLLTLYSMIKIWAEVFWKSVPPEGDVDPYPAVDPREMWLMAVPVAGLALCTLFIGLNAEPLYALAEASAGQLLAPDRYIQAVLDHGREVAP